MQIGVRAIDNAEAKLLAKSKIQVYEMRHVERDGIQTVMDNILASCEGESSHIHVSFDVDALDPLVAPGVGTTEHGGLSFKQASLALQMIKGHGHVGTVDIFELNPAFDHKNQTAHVMVDLMKSLF
jgi:arginase